MTEANDDSQKARAKKLREEIQKLKKVPAEKPGSEPESAPAGPESPREFVQRKMRELDPKKTDKS